jgi:cell division protein FtsB
MSRDEFTEAEREALEAWEVTSPPTDLARRVVQRASAAGPARAKGRSQGGTLRGTLRLALAAAACLAAAAGIGWLVWPGGGAVNGRARATERTSYSLGQRAVAVAEAGAALSWELAAAGGPARVQQDAGDVFYRVDPGGPFTVETPAGKVRVLGTCFRTEVIKMKTSRAGLAGVAVGAATAAIVVVTVYEGRVLTATPRGEVQLEAGQVAQLERDKAPRVLDEGAAATASGGAGGAAGRAAAGGRRRGPAVAALQQQNVKLSQDKQRLEQQVAALRSQLTETDGVKGKTKILDLSKQDLLALAKRCELRWDMPSLGGKPGVDSKAVKELGLTSDEQALIKKALVEHRAQMQGALRKLYTEVTGDDKGVEVLSLRALISEIKDKSPRSAIKQVFQRLARERAGLQAPPAGSALQSASAVDRLYRMLVGSGDRLERAVGGQIGPDLAARYRRLRDGYGSRSRSSYGCPRGGAGR